MAFTYFVNPLPSEMLHPLDYSLMNFLSSPSTELMGPYHCRMAVRPRRQESVDSSKSALSKSDPNKWNVFLNVKHFKPDELEVKVVDNFIVVHGKHEMECDEHGFVSREFTRKYAIPEDVEADKVQSSISKDGILTIHAPRKVKKLPSNERVIPITIVNSVIKEAQLNKTEEPQTPQPAKEEPQTPQPAKEEPQTQQPAEEQKNDEKPSES